jgi:hypothetical protein
MKNIVMSYKSLAVFFFVTSLTDVVKNVLFCISYQKITWKMVVLCKRYAGNMRKYVPGSSVNLQFHMDWYSQLVNGSIHNVELKYLAALILLVLYIYIRVSTAIFILASACFGCTQLSSVTYQFCQNVFTVIVSSSECDVNFQILFYMHNFLKSSIKINLKYVH